VCVTEGIDAAGRRGDPIAATVGRGGNGHRTVRAWRRCRRGGSRSARGGTPDQRGGQHDAGGEEGGPTTAETTQLQAQGQRQGPQARRADGPNRATRGCDGQTEGHAPRTVGPVTFLRCTQRPAGFQARSTTAACVMGKGVIGRGFRVYIPTRSPSGYIHIAGEAEESRPARINALHLGKCVPHLYIQLLSRRRAPRSLEQD
jgi:hypothetical protein